MTNSPQEGTAGGADDEQLPVIGTLADLTEIVAADPRVYLRHSKGPRADAEEGPSRDYEAHLTLPGLSVTTLSPEPWWQRPVVEWVARRIQKYAELSEEQDRFAWLLTGTEVGRGPDHEPLLTNIRPRARLDRRVLDEAARLYHERFDVGRDSTN
jgi:hypothetical protein